MLTTDQVSGLLSAAPQTRSRLRRFPRWDDVRFCAAASACLCGHSL